MARCQTGYREKVKVKVKTKPGLTSTSTSTCPWESDQLIVVLKQGNACGAKGLAGEPRSRDTSSGHGTGAKKSAKLASMTHLTEVRRSS